MHADRERRYGQQRDPQCSYESSSTVYNMGLCTVPIAEKTTGLILGIVNILFPGIGAIVAAILLQGSKGSIDISLLMAGILQLLTVWLLVGWIWAIVWGIQLIAKSTDEENKYEIALGGVKNNTDVENATGNAPTAPEAAAAPSAS